MMGTPTYMRPLGDAKEALRRKGRGDIQCDECFGLFRPWRITKVMEGAGISSGAPALYCFCDDCHPQVFREASHDKYPELFSRVVELTDEMQQWQTAGEMAKHFGLRNASSFGNYARQGAGEVFGRQLESEYCGTRRKYVYRVVG